MTSSDLTKADNGISIPSIKRVNFLKNMHFNFEVLHIGHIHCNLFLAILKFIILPRDCCRFGIIGSILKIYRSLDRDQKTVIILDTDYMIVFVILFSFLPGCKNREFIIVPNDFPLLVVASQLKYKQFDHSLQRLLLKFEFFKTKLLWMLASLIKSEIAFLGRADIRYMKKNSLKGIKAKIHLIKNGTQNLQNICHKTCHKNTREKIYLLHVGSIVRGQRRYLENFIDSVFLNCKNKNLVLHCVGFRVDEGFRDKYKEISNIIVYENVSDLTEVYLKSDIVINTAKKLAGQFNKTMEGMAYGKTVIGYKMTFYGIEGTKNYQNCIKVRSEQEFCSVLENVDMLQCENIGQAAQQLMQTNYDWTVTLRSFNNLISCSAK